MNPIRSREAYRRRLTHRMAQLRLLISEQIVRRETSIREHGIAHPRSIDVSRRLNQTLGGWRHLRRMHHTSTSRDGRKVDRVR
jgi:hypothetical protein